MKEEIYSEQHFRPNKNWWSLAATLHRTPNFIVESFMNDVQERLYIQIVRQDTHEVVYETWHPYKALRHFEGAVEAVLQSARDEGEKIRRELIDAVDWYTYFDEEPSGIDLFFFQNEFLTPNEIREMYGVNPLAERSDPETL